MSHFSDAECIHLGSTPACPGDGETLVPGNPHNLASTRRFPKQETGYPTWWLGTRVSRFPVTWGEAAPPPTPWPHSYPLCLRLGLSHAPHPAGWETPGEAGGVGSCRGGSGHSSEASLSIRRVAGSAPAPGAAGCAVCGGRPAFPSLRVLICTVGMMLTSRGVLCLFVKRGIRAETCSVMLTCRLTTVP